MTKVSAVRSVARRLTLKQAVAPSPTTAQSTSGFRFVNPFTAKGGIVDDTKNLVRSITSRLRTPTSRPTPRPVVGASTPIVTR